MFLCVVLIVRWVELASGKVDVFVSNEEMKRNLGLNITLAYVENGELNDYTLKFQLPVPKNVSKLNFHWRRRTNDNIFYSLSTSVEKPGYVEAPTFNVPIKGVIPYRQEVFSVTLRCTGQKSGEVGIEIILNYTYPSLRNITSLRIHRKKNCARSSSVHVTGGANHGTNKHLWSDESYWENMGFFSSATNIFYVAIGGVFGLIVVIASLMIIYFTRVRKPNDLQELQPCVPVPIQTHAHQLQSRQTSTVPSQRPPPSSFPCYAQQAVNGMAMHASFLASNSPSSGSQYTALASRTSANLRYQGKVPVVDVPLLVAQSRETDIPLALRELEVEQSRVQFGNLLLEGNFGEVFGGVLSNNGRQLDVIIKTVKKSLTFYGVPAHPNVSFVIAASYGGESLPALCYFHRGFGNLKKFLLRCSGAEFGSSHSHSHSLSTQNLVYMALHIVRGVMHLHAHGIVHRDIATRTCIVSEEMTVQVCDTGLSRDLFPQDYHCLGDNENRPVKWMALESIEKNDFTSASDAWAFGVTLWELVSLAQQPYHEVDPFEMAGYLLEDQRLYQPYNCPDELYGLMFCCWNLHPEARPTFAQLLGALEDFYGRLTEYI